MYSKNEDADRIMGKRNFGVKHCTILFSPAEEGFSCPVCKNQIWYNKDSIDERLQWSEYNGFLWCEICNKDYPSCLCIRDDIDKAIDVFLKSVESVKEGDNGENKKGQTQEGNGSARKSSEQGSGD